MNKTKPLFAFLLVPFIAACSFVPPAPDRDADILVVGDSILAWHRGSGRAIPDIVEQATGLSVSNVAVSGAQVMSLPTNIATQFVEGDWDWVIMDGGGNDLFPACGSPNEGVVLNALISADGQRGAIPVFANDVAQQGVQIIMLGYYPVSNQGGPFAPCAEALDELAARQARMADGNENITFVDAGLVIGAGNVAAYAPDLVHPSPRGAILVGQLIASVINNAKR